MFHLSSTLFSAFQEMNNILNQRCSCRQCSGEQKQTNMNISYKTSIIPVVKWKGMLATVRNKSKHCVTPSKKKTINNPIPSMVGSQNQLCEQDLWYTTRDCHNSLMYPSPANTPNDEVSSNRMWDQLHIPRLHANLISCSIGQQRQAHSKEY